MEELLKQLLQAELAKAQAAAAAPVAQPVVEVQKAQTVEAPAIDADALVAKLMEQMAPKIADMVAKAQPEMKREEGAGRAVAADKTGQSGMSGEAQTIEELVAKARTGHKNLSPREKNSLFNLTARVLGHNLQEGGAD